MPAIDPRLPPILLQLLIAALYIPAIMRAVQHEDGQEATTYTLAAIYAGLALVIQVVAALNYGGIFDNSAPIFYEEIQWYGMLALALLFLLTLRSFLRLESNEIWAVAGGVWFVLIILVATNVFNLPEILWQNDQWILPRERLPFGMALAGWVVFLGWAALTVRSAYRKTRQSLHRNRLTYWLPALILVVVNDGFLTAYPQTWSNLTRLLAALLVTYILTNHNMPDVRQIVKQTLIYIITTLVIVLFYTAGFAFSQYLFQTASNFNPTVVGAVIALLLALIFTPLLGLVRSLVDRLMSSGFYDPAQTLRDYSQSISNILEMERLASVAVGMIIEALQIQRGVLFLVDKETGAENRVQYHLRVVRSAGERAVKVGTLQGDSPVAAYLSQGNRPLLQYDMDLLPAFQKTPSNEREWFDRLNTEVYVPIHAKREWIGLLALGAKLSGNRYTDEDLVTLSTVGSQTAVALENARLVENLMRLNQEIRTAYRALDKANRDLERIDRTKSNFISIASHELRTPLTVMRGYTEMLLEDPGVEQNAYYKQMLKGIHDSTLRMHEIMDSMFDIAQIDARSLELHLQPVDVNELAKSVGLTLQAAIKEREQTLTIDLPTLPALKADPNTLRKVFHHLLTNAIKFTPNGGKLCITGKPVLPVLNELPNGGVHYIFSDTGVGIDPNFRDLIFTKFYQPNEDLNRHSTGKTKFKGAGAGLGLPLARGIVEAHGGKIWVESPGFDEVNFPGSRFNVLLPLRDKPDGNESYLSQPVNLTLN
ncbi:MAG: GAF domain-containing sensor histidine kinase [Chloroflexota bacterium]